MVILKMNEIDKIAVCSRSFSKNETLKKLLLSKYKNVKFNETGKQLDGSQLVNFLKDSTKAIVGLEKIDEIILRESTDLKVISKYGVGIDSLDLSALKKYKIYLGWSPGVNKRSVAELILGLTINLLRKISISNKSLLKGQWIQHTGEQLTGKTFGIVGCGNIGKEVVKLLQPFNCEILISDIKVYSDFNLNYNLKKVELNTLLKRSDIISINIPYNLNTINLFSTDKIDLIKCSAILINTSRGGLVDENALKQALKNNKIAGAAFDVFKSEPPIDKELINLPNFLATSHIGGSTSEAILQMGLAAINGLDDNRLVNDIYL